MAKYNFIYKTTNIINGKIYVGRHSTNYLNDGYLGSGIKFNIELRKYGTLHFKREILEICEEEDLKSSEAFWIKELDATGLGGYNKVKHTQITNSLTKENIEESGDFYSEFFLNKPGELFVSKAITHKVSMNCSVVFSLLIENYFTNFKKWINLKDKSMIGFISETKLHKSLSRLNEVNIIDIEYFQNTKFVKINWEVFNKIDAENIIEMSI